MQIKTGFAKIQNTKLYFEMKGTGKPLLLLHSGSSDHRMWAEQCRKLSRYFQVIIPDFRGYGKSPAPSEPFSHFEDMFYFIQNLKLKNVNIVGCSLGGKVAIELVIAHPEAVNRLILVSPGLNGYEYQDVETLEKDAILEELIADGKRQEVADLLIDIWVVGLKRKRDTVSLDVISLVREMILDNYYSVVDKYPETSPGFNVISRLNEIHVPTLVMIGDEDLSDMLAISQLVADRIPGAKRLEINNAAHLPNLENGTLFNQSVIDFLTQV